MLRILCLLAMGLALLAGVNAPAHAAPDDAGHSAYDLSHHNAGDSLFEPHEFRYDLAIYTFVVFLLMFLILSKFAWGPISQGLAAREQNIAANIAAAEDAAAKAQKLTNEYEAKLAAAADEVRLMIEEARRDAEHTKAQILSEAASAADAEHLRAVREINVAKDGALKELATVAAQQAVELAGRVVRTKLTAEEQSELVQRALDSLPHTLPSKN